MVFLLIGITFPLIAASQTEQDGEQIVAQADTSESIWGKITGRKSPNSVLIGMLSLHLDGSGEILSGGHHNEHHGLKGLQYGGFALCFFTNSHEKNCVYGGFAREFVRHEINRDFHFDLNYKIGLIHGYGKKLPNIEGISFFFTPFVSFTYQKAGIDFGLVPMGVLTANFRFTL